MLQLVLLLLLLLAVGTANDLSDDPIYTDDTAVRAEQCENTSRTSSWKMPQCHIFVPLLLRRSSSNTAELSGCTGSLLDGAAKRGCKERRR